MFALQKVHYVFLAVFLLLLLLSFFIIESFLIPLLFTFILVVLLNPVYEYLRKYLKYHGLVAFVLIFLFLSMTVIPISLGVLQISKELTQLNHSQAIDTLDKVESLFLGFGFNINLDEIYLQLLASLKSELNGLLSSVPLFIFQLFLLFFFYFYFSKNYFHDAAYFYSLSAHKDKRFSVLLLKIKSLITGVLMGQILVRFIQASLFGVVYFILGIQGAVIFAVLTFFMAFIPVIGTGFVWLSLVALFLVKGMYLEAFLLVVSGTIISTIDNILLPIIVSEKTNMGPVMTLLSIIGGIKLFSFYGIILGPFIVGVFLLFLDEILVSLRKQAPSLRKYVWSENERKQFRKLKSDELKKKFIEKINIKYSKLQGVEDK